MHRISSDKEYYENGKVAIDADGIPVDLGYRGTGSPEGKIAAPVGSVYTDAAATNGAIRWIKTSGTGSTGWRVEYGDTGWRDISSLLGSGWTGTVAIKRDRDEVYMRVNGATRGGASIVMVSIPSGMNPNNPSGVWRGVLNELLTLPTPVHRVYQGGGDLRVGAGTESKSLYGELTWLTSDAWPTSLPGTPA